MDPRPLALAVPAAVVLAMLVAHSMSALPRRRALAFWAAAAVYGVARGVALHAVVEGGLQASFPYRIDRPLLPVFGVPLQEIAGWAIVVYLGWWLGDRFSAREGGERSGGRQDGADGSIEIREKALKVDDGGAAVDAVRVPGDLDLTCVAGRAGHPDRRHALLVGNREPYG